MCALQFIQIFSTKLCRSLPLSPSRLRAHLFLLSATPPPPLRFPFVSIFHFFSCSLITSLPSPRLSSLCSSHFLFHIFPLHLGLIVGLIRSDCFLLLRYFFFPPSVGQNVPQDPAIDIHYLSPALFKYPHFQLLRYKKPQNNIFDLLSSA